VVVLSQLCQHLIQFYLCTLLVLLVLSRLHQYLHNFIPTASVLSVFSPQLSQCCSSLIPTVSACCTVLFKLPQYFVSYIVSTWVPPQFYPNCHSTAVVSSQLCQHLIQFYSNCLSILLVLSRLHQHLRNFIPTAAVLSVFITQLPQYCGSFVPTVSASCTVLFKLSQYLVSFISSTSVPPHFSTCLLLISPATLLLYFHLKCINSLVALSWLTDYPHSFFPAVSMSSVAMWHTTVLLCSWRWNRDGGGISQTLPILLPARPSSCFRRQRNHSLTVVSSYRILCV